MADKPPRVPRRVPDHVDPADPTVAAETPLIPRQPLFTFAQVATLLDVSVRTVERKADAGVFGEVLTLGSGPRPGRRIRYEGLAAFLSLDPAA